MVRWLSAHTLNVSRVALVGLLLTMVGLQLAAGIGLAWVAGFGAVRATLGHITWPWLAGIAGVLVVSFAGYYHAYRGTFTDGSHGSLPRRQMLSVALAGFGGVLAHGATALDVAALHAEGASDREASVRVSAFGGLEAGVLAIGGCGAAIAVLVLGLPRPSPGFTLPWAIIPLPGFLVGFWLARHYADRLAPRDGWRGRLGVFLESIEVVRGLFAHPFRRNPAVFGMALFWTGDAFAAWSGLALFDTRMNVAQFVVGYATGMVFTRRVVPLAGAGLLSLILPLMLWYSGAPLAVAVPGIFAYQLLTLWLPLPASLAIRRTLRSLV